VSPRPNKPWAALAFGVLLWVAGGAAWSAQTEFGILTVRMTGLKSDKGTVRVALFDSRDTYRQLTKAVRSDVLPVKSGKCEWTVDALPYGEYVAVFFHDENNNKKQDKFFGGFPTEPYRYSNNPVVVLNWGKPAYKEVFFVLYQKKQSITILGNPREK
jgi:uncharacterized protein (DUF2141 family)